VVTDLTSFVTPSFKVQTLFLSLKIITECLCHKLLSKGHRAHNLRARGVVINGASNSGSNSIQ